MNGEVLEDLVEWELSGMSLDDLQEFFVNNMTDFYRENPQAFKDMLDYKKGIDEVDGIY